ncbi:hypothetical protein GWK47_016036 [Chionoecetes opilio]|uniref:Uncharacterized protein n=1 Tax=Chionoecetes opilio TaxID=41210 RepID=A0A8J4XYK1_CHIOP|nr:hypothetical protein GWK47_016036 [Chionoecetes opilio]
MRERGGEDDREREKTFYRALPSNNIPQVIGLKGSHLNRFLPIRWQGRVGRQGRLYVRPAPEIDDVTDDLSIFAVLCVMVVAALAMPNPDADADPEASRWGGGHYNSPPPHSHSHTHHQGHIHHYTHYPGGHSTGTSTTPTGSPARLTTT